MNEIRLTVQRVVGFVRSVLVRRHELSKLDARLELRIQEVVLVKRNTKVAFFNNLCTHSDFHKSNESHCVSYETMNGAHSETQDARAG